MTEPQAILIRADFNGLFDDLLCLSHSDSCVGEDGMQIAVHEGMAVTAFDEDEDAEGKPDRLLATGTVIRSPEWLACTGSRWALKINRDGVRHESDLTA